MPLKEIDHTYYNVIQQLHFDVIGCKTSVTPSVIFRFIRRNAWQESSKFYSDLRRASSLELTRYYCVNCHYNQELALPLISSCYNIVTMPIKLSSYVTGSTSEMIPSV